MQAARSVGAFARPLPLFYALSQGGRAILAAHATKPWKARGHGLREVELKEPILDSTIGPTRNGLFPRVCETLGTGPLTDSIELGAAWLAIPELAFTVPPAPPWTRALRVFPEDTEKTFGLLHGGGVLVVPYEHRADELPDALANYPAADDARFARIPGAGLQSAPTPLGQG
jgi:YaaC-like Protein